MTEFSITSVASQRFLPGLMVSLFSLSCHLRGFDDADVNILFSRRLSPLSGSSLTGFQRAFPNVRFTEIDDTIYLQPDIEHEPHRGAFLTLEVFRTNVGRPTLFLDADTLCIRDFSEIILDCPPNTMRAAECPNGEGGRFSTGVFVVGGAIPGPLSYGFMRKNVAGAFSYMLDQPIINRFVAQERVDCRCLGEEYNFMRMGGHKKYPDDHEFIKSFPRVRILHWAGREANRKKPWTEPRPDLPSWLIWNSYYAAALDKFSFLRPTLVG